MTDILALAYESATRSQSAMTYFKLQNMGDVRLRLGGLDDAVPVTLAMEHGRIVDEFSAAGLKANMDKMHEYLGV